MATRAPRLLEGFPFICAHAPRLEGRARPRTQPPKGERNERQPSRTDQRGLKSPLGGKYILHSPPLSFSLSLFPSSFLHGGNRPSVYRRTQLSCALLRRSPCSSGEKLLELISLRFLIRRVSVRMVKGTCSPGGTSAYRPPRINLASTSLL